MVTAAIINFMFYAIAFWVGLLPTASLPFSLTSAISSASGYLTSLDSVLPMTVIISTFTFFLLFEGGYLTYKVIYWIIKKIPTIS